MNVGDHNLILSHWFQLLNLYIDLYILLGGCLVAIAFCLLVLA